MRPPIVVGQVFNLPEMPRLFTPMLDLTDLTTFLTSGFESVLTQAFPHRQMSVDTSTTAS